MAGAYKVTSRPSPPQSWNCLTKLWHHFPPSACVNKSAAFLGCRGHLAFPPCIPSHPPLPIQVSPVPTFGLALFPSIFSTLRLLLLLSPTLPGLPSTPRYVGVTSGGMDQAISVMGQPLVAKLVEFNPVRRGATW